jgi:hypothetical protein
MDSSYTTTHLDPFEKLKLGWLPWTAVRASCELALGEVETEGTVLVLHDPRRGPKEYFLVENRWRGSSYDAGLPRAGGGLPQDGLAVWHVIEDPALWKQVESGASQRDWGRRGLRLIRRNGGTPRDDSKALLAAPGDGIDDRTGPARLVWLDGSRSGFSVTLVSAPGASVRVRVGRVVYH